MAYTDEQKQMALSTYTACRNNATQAARFCRDHYGFNVSPDQITNWFRGLHIATQVRENSEAVKKTLAEKCEDTAQKLLDAIMGNIEGASLGQQATAFGIVADKMLLFRGEANQILGRHISKEEAALELMKLVAKYGDGNTP